MKNCNEMVNSLLERRDRYVAEQKRKRKVITRTATSLCCVCLVALLGFGVSERELFATTPPVTSENVSNIGEKDYISSDEPNNSTQENTSNQSSDAVNHNSSDNSSATANGNVVHLPNNDSPNVSEKTMISSFNIDETPSASYVTPENGKFYFSTPLREAMNEYENNVMYRVVVNVFKDKERLSSNSIQVQDECERLSNIGYIVAYETFFDGEIYHYYFTLHADYNKLKEFVPNESYGYFIFLYDEQVE